MLKRTNTASCADASGRFAGGWRASFAVGLLGILMAMPANAGQYDALLAKWYQAMGDADAVAIEPLIAPEAIFTLEEFGSTQTKDELIDYMKQWDERLSRSAIRHKIVATSGDTVTVHVCYGFDEGPFTNREIYRIEGNRIAAASQARLADNCDTF